MDNQFKVWSTDKLVIFTVPKVASRFIEYSLQQSNINPHANNVYIDDDFKLKETRLSNLSNELSNDIKNINNNKNKKDLLFLYRNPKTKLLSAIVQDFNENIKNDKFLFDIFLD